MLDQAQRKRADLFALMASTPVLSSEDVPPPRTFDDIVCPRFEDIEDRSRTTLTKQFDRVCRARRRGQPQGWGLLSAEEAPRVLAVAWEEVWLILNQLLEGRSAYLGHARPFLRLKDGVLREGFVEGQAGFAWLLGDFYELLRAKPFPFARCPNCRSIFVRSGRQRYCSRSCASRWLESARKGKRREYMRQLMARRREMARRVAAKQLTTSVTKKPQSVSDESRNTRPRGKKPS